MTNIPAPVLEVFKPLQVEVVWLHARWQVARQLFATSKRRVGLLNECAPAALRFIEDVMLDDVQLALSRLTDPAKSLNKLDNLTIPQLHERIAQIGQPTLVAQLQTLLDRLKAECEPLRVQRNKRIAHLDLNTVVNATANPLPSVGRRDRTGA